MSARFFVGVLTFSLGLLGLSTLSLANDVVFIADESDVSAFDQMLDRQRNRDLKALGPDRATTAPGRAKENFGAEVREEAKRLQTGSGLKPGEMGEFVREQRRQNTLQRGRGAGGNSGKSKAGSVRGQVSETRAFVSERKGGSKTSNNGRRERDRDR